MHYKYALAALLISLVIAVAVASIMKTIYLPTTFTIQKSYNINLFDVDGSTPLTSLNLGQLQKDSNKFFPGGVGSISDLPGYYYLNNTSEGAFYLGFNVSGAPENMTFRVYICKGNATELSDTNLWSQLTVDTIAPATVIYNKVIESPITNTDPNTQYARWFLCVFASLYTTGDDYTVDLVFTAHDSPSG